MIIDYKKLAVLLLPTFLRQPVIMSLLRVMMIPLQAMHDRHQRNRDIRLYEIAHTSQSCNIKAALNDEFEIPDYGAGFEIEDVNAIGEWVVVYDEAPEFDTEDYAVIADDNSPVVYDESLIVTPTVAFNVIVPASVEWNDYNLARIKSVVNKYRLASRTFNIRQ